MKTWKKGKIMECYDRTAHVYYPRHLEYVGPRPDLLGRCVRCNQITDAELAAAGAKAIKRAEKEISEYEQLRERDREAYRTLIDGPKHEWR